MQTNEITNKYIWEGFISKISPQSLFQSWNWGEVINHSNRNKLRRSVWRYGFSEKDKLVGIAQINRVEAKKGIFLHVRHGPILSNFSENIIRYVFNELRKLAIKEKANYIRISPLLEVSNKSISLINQSGFINAPIHSMDGEIVWVLKLDKSLDELLSGMRKTTRYLIRKGEKMGIKIIKTQNKKDLDEFLELYNLTAKRHKFVPHKSIKEEFEFFLRDNQILLFKGYFNNKLIAAALILFYNESAIYHHSASLESKIPVSYLLQWEVIKESIQRKQRKYNFWGIASDDNPYHPWTNLSSFKKGFGGEKHEYVHAKDLPITKKYYITYLLESARRILKGY